MEDDVNNNWLQKSTDHAYNMLKIHNTEETLDLQ